MGALTLACASVWLISGSAQAQTTGPLVFAAASLKNALDEIAAGWAKDGKPPIRLSYAASNTLAKQIEQGAPADVFFSADLDWMDYAESKGLIRPGTRVNLLANALVLIAPSDSAAMVSVGPGLDLKGVLGSGRLAMGDVAAVPASCRPR
jgi:molybdate transport system substrate-binding protein